MWKRFAAIAVLFLSLCVQPPALADGGPFPGVHPAVETTEKAEICAPWFPFRHGWQGGDAAYSVALPDGRVLWLFGDTFIGRTGAANRRRAKFIGNSIALSACRAGQWSIRYFWRHGHEDPVPVFTPPDTEGAKDEVRYWPLDGFAHDGALYVFLSRIRTTDLESPLGFAVEGVDLARITGLDPSPERWRITYRPVLRGNALPGAAVLKRETHVLLYTPLTGEVYKRHPVALARLPLNRLDAPAEHLQYLARGGSWRKGFVAALARRIMEQGAPELSVQETADGRFMVVMSEAAFPADRIVLRTAPAPEGPWSDDVAVALIPDRTAARGTRRARVFCYAAKAWEPATHATTLMVTYVCNSTDAELLLEDMNLYRPRARQVTLPEAP